MKFTCRSAILGLVWLSPVLIAAGPQDVQRDIPRDAKSSDAPVLSYPLPLGGALQHAQYAGRLRRVDANGNEMAKAKVPAAKIIASSTQLVLSSDFARVLMLHSADDMKFKAKHRVALLEMTQLKTMWDLPLGHCQSVRRDLPAVTARLALLCYHSQPPRDAKQKPTLALVTIDLDRGEVVGWHALGGERHGIWFGPMFFGWTYDVNSVPVRQTRTCDSSDETTSDQAELPLVLNRKSETSKGEVWLVNTQSVGPPRRLAVISGHPRSALVCTSVTGVPTLQVSVDLRTTKEINAAPGFAPAFLRVDTFDLATGQLIVQ